AHYRVERDGTELWSGDRPWTLWESAVTDDGVVAGYAYGHGVEGWSGVRGDFDVGDLRVVILDASGKPRLDWSTPREAARQMHAAPQPLGHGVLLDPGSDRLVVRVSNSNLEDDTDTWWVFQLSDGAMLPAVQPRAHMAGDSTARWMLGARFVPSTPLVL